MKLLIVALVVVYGITADAHMTEETRKKIHESVKACAAEHNIDQKLLDEISEKNHIDNEELYCFANCVNHKMEIVDADGNLLAEKLIADLIGHHETMREGVTAMVEKCKELDGATDCEKAAKISNCIMDSKLLPVGHAAA